MPTVLIIDDEPISITILTIRLTAAGYNVVSQDGGLGGLSYLREHHSEIDVVMLDMMMPDLYGLEVLVHMKADAHLASIPVILQTGLADIEDIERGRVLGAFDVVFKPFDFEVILTTLEKALYDSSFVLKSDIEGRLQF